MNRGIACVLAGALMVVVPAAEGVRPSPEAPGTGTIKGHVRLAGKPPGNSIIRMGMDPKCADLNRGKRVFQEAVVVAPDGSLANVFVRLQGTFPPSPVPTAPVTIDQRGCIYSPRVVGIRVGQPLQIRNNDDLLHNVHGVSDHGNGFNAGQAKAGVVDNFRMKEEEVPVRLRCDLHRWMTAYIAVVNNPYFAVSSRAGSFEILQVPPGTYTLQAWHERYGPINRRVRVSAGTTTSVELSYSGNEPPLTP